MNKYSRIWGTLWVFLAIFFWIWGNDNGAIIILLIAIYEAIYNPK